MPILKPATLPAINAHNDSKVHTFYEHIKIPYTQPYSATNARPVAVNLSVIIIWW